MSEDLSKTARKREAERLQLVGRKLTEMKPDVLATIQMSPALREAIATHQRISSREGGRRQLQFIGKLMRKIDTEALEKQLADLDGQSNDARTFFHQLEQWRDRLVKQPDTMKDFLSISTRKLIDNNCAKLWLKPQLLNPTMVNLPMMHTSVR